LVLVISLWNKISAQIIYLHTFILNFYKLLYSTKNWNIWIFFFVLCTYNYTSI